MRRGIILQEANPMSGVFQNIDPPPPSALTARWGEDTLAGRRGGGGGGVNSLEGARTALYTIYVSTLWLHVSILSKLI